jgi:hypothetical protein
MRSSCYVSSLVEKCGEIFQCTGCCCLSEYGKERGCYSASGGGGWRMFLKHMPYAQPRQLAMWNSPPLSKCFGYFVLAGLVYRIIVTEQ